MTTGGSVPANDPLRQEIADQRAETATLRENARTSERNEGWLTAQKDTFQAAMNGAPLETSLAIMIRTVIAQADGEPRCAFYINTGNGGLHHLVGVPETDADRVRDFEKSLESLTYGPAAANEAPVITPDVLDEPRWQPWTWLAKEQGYRACWSFPVETTSGRLVGFFAMYFSEPRQPSQPDLDRAEALTQTAAIIISRHQEAEERTRAEEALRASEARQNLLISELQHRVRNILATVRAIASRTGRNYRSVADFQAHFDGRLSALGRTQSVLTRTPGTGADLENLVRQELVAQAAPEQQIALAGSPIRLPPKAAEVVTLAVHELATNSVKYGALAQQRALINIAWTVAERDGETWLSIGWSESAVRMPKTKPTRQGFGTELITRRIPHELHGEGSIVFAKDGLRANISFPLREAHSALETGFALPPEGPTS
ncbi:sensor histidine kinase [Bradyrhizobium sp. GCM10027634]|uniref:sensor histidine kinase n=1 Tax=unclassified Bradyrhizobium TaxID=2631580 RepID=UPI00188D92EB|nr:MULTISPECIES: HWE histidine kinase domain-containing protein [unclassified Bradyrhizobium]MDN5001516.1 HWE histidine kinase domain-containing protein [Bradyrhizobium sp. WYCCWR 12677]QOZ46142.1 hypothetical protein XH89_23675 [Bradyrhizobium sp. CCBAU 53340]